MRFFTARQLSSWSRRTPPKCARVAKLTAGGFPWLVAEGDGRVTGYAYAGPYHDRPAYRWALENSVYIAPDSTRRGIGRALLEALVAESESRGFRQMTAVIGDAANAASIGLHRACGFGHVGTLDAVGYKHGRWLSVVMMQRALGPGSATNPSDHPAM